VGRYLDDRGDFRLALSYTFEDVGLLSLDEYKERLYGGQMYRNGLTSSVGISLDIDRRNPNAAAPRRAARPHRARWWFSQMRAVVNSAMDWTPAPPARPEQVVLRLS